MNIENELDSPIDIVNPYTLTYGVSSEQELKIKSVDTDLHYANLVEIDSEQSYSIAAENLILLKNKKKELVAVRKSITQPIDEHKKNALGLFREPESKLDQAISVVKNCMVTYLREQELIAKKLEAQQLETIRKREEKLREKAEKAESKGQIEKADNFHQQADSIPMPVQQTMKPKYKGISTRKTWFAIITNERELLAAIVSGQVPMAAIKFDTVFLNRQATALKKELNYPGVIVKQKDGIAVRA